MSTNRLGTYAPNQVSVLITQESTGIVHQLSGFSEDSIVSIDRNADTFTLYTGADDTNTRIFHANTAATVTVSLQQTSNSNDILTMLYENDRRTFDSSGLFSFQIKDLTGRSLYFAEEAYIGIIPSSAFSNSMNTRDWVFHTPKLQTYIGGNSKFSPEDITTMEALGAEVDDRWR